MLLFIDAFSKSWESAHIQLGLQLSYKSAFFLCLLIMSDTGVMTSLPLARGVRCQINACVCTVPFSLEGQLAFPFSWAGFE